MLCLGEDPGSWENSKVEPGGGVPSTHNGTSSKGSAGGMQAVSAKVELAEDTDPGLDG